MIQTTSIMKKGLLVVAIIIAFVITLVLLSWSAYNTQKESAESAERAKNVVAHIEKLRNYFEMCVESMARFKSSDFAEQDSKKFELAEESVLHEVRKLKEAVKNSPVELQCVSRLEYGAVQAKKISAQYQEELQGGNMFGQTTTLLRLAKIGKRIEPDIEFLRVPYEEQEQKYHLEALKRGEYLTQLLFGGLVLTTTVSIALILWFANNISRRLNVVVENIRRFERKQLLMPIIATDKDEIHVVDVRFHQMARELTEAEKRAREVEQLKQDFVSMISHDLRSPLTSLQFTLSLLGDGTYGDINEKGQQRVSTASNSVVRLIGLINDLLDLEKMESGMMNLQLTEFNLSDLFDEAIGSVTGMAESANIKLDSKAIDVVVDGDIQRLGQVLVNLLSNAIKFSPEGSTVSLVAEDGGPKFLKISVVDRGRGIPEEFQRSIFERFKQVKDADGQPKKGTGLGLAIAKQIVELHGGSIGVESVEGAGSTFWLRIPKSATVPSVV